MAVLGSIFGVLGRFLGRLVSMLLGWATTLLFGRVPQSKQYLILGISAGSIAWIIALLGVLIPDLGTFMLAAVPVPRFIREEWVRLAMLAAAIALPLLVGVAGYLLLDADQRPRGAGLVVQLLRGYPYAAVLALTIVFLFFMAPVRKVRSLLKRWQDAHIPVVVKPGGYEKVADDLEAALDQAELGVDRRPAPRVLELPSKLLAAVAGPGVAALVPDRLVVLGSESLEVLVHPSDIAISGTREHLARARAAVASRLAFTAAYQTSTKDSQVIEDRLERIWSAAHGVSSPGKGGTPEPEEQVERTYESSESSPSSDRARQVRSPEELTVEDIDRLSQTLDGVDHDLARLEVPYEDWEVLYRLRLQVERDILERRMQLRDSPEHEGPVAAAATGVGMGLATSLDVGLALLERAASGTFLARLARLLRRALA